jgi:hypothetical protein
VVVEWQAQQIIVTNNELVSAWYRSLVQCRALTSQPGTLDVDGVTMVVGDAFNRTVDGAFISLSDLAAYYDSNVSAGTGHM